MQLIKQFWLLYSVNCLTSKVVIELKFHEVHNIGIKPVLFFKC